MHCRAIDYRTERLLEEHWFLQCRIRGGPAYQLSELQDRLAEVARQLAERVRQ